MNGSPSQPSDLDVRSLRYFVAVAEELHFTRAASRMFVAQQALSRDIRNLEQRLGTTLFVRTTRRVTLTPEGERLLGKARTLLALHDEIVEDVHQPARPLLVDLMSEGRRTAVRVLEAARAAAPEFEFRGRFGGGMGMSMLRLRDAELDIAFGRADWRWQASIPGLERELVRFEPLAVLLPEDHQLARGDAVRVHSLRGLEIDVNLANPDAPEWSDLASQFIALAGASATPAHVPAVGLDDQAHHLVQQGLPILTTADHVAVPGGVLRPLVDPVPLYVWSVVWRPGTNPGGLGSIRAAARRLAAEDDWLRQPDDAWLPEPEASKIRT